MTSEPTPGYRPVACGLHSRLEEAIVRRTPVTCVWRDAAGMRHEGSLLPLDLVSRDRAEYLVGESARGRVEIRLDRIDRWRIGDEEADTRDPGE